MSKVHNVGKEVVGADSGRHNRENEISFVSRCQNPKFESWF